MHLAPLVTVLRRTRSKARPPILWHYTVGASLPDILRSGELRPSGGGRVGELPAVWFSLRQGWDPGVGLGTLAERLRITPEMAAAIDGALDGVSSIEGLRDPARRAALVRALEGPVIWPAELGGLARIGVEPESVPLTWGDFVSAGGLDASVAEIQEAIDRERGCSHDEWRFSPVPVPADKWIAIEWRSGTREGERWEPWTPTRHDTFPAAADKRTETTPSADG